MEADPIPASLAVAKDLSKVPEFGLGPLAVDPPARRIAAGGRSEMLEPRVMRVLVALGAVPGKVLSRDDLIEQCWDGTIVGDNAIDRVISRLRNVLDNLSHGAVRLETITKVGFRLVVASHEQVAIGVPGPAVDGAPPRQAAKADAPSGGRRDCRDRSGGRARLRGLEPVRIA